MRYYGDKSCPLALKCVHFDSVATINHDEPLCHVPVYPYPLKNADVIFPKPKVTITLTHTRQQ